MRWMKPALAISAAVVIVMGCNAPRPDPSVCAMPSPPSEEDADRARDAALRTAGVTPIRRMEILRAHTDHCLLRWSYRLASSAEPLDTIGQAVVTACEASVTELAQANRLAEDNSTGSAPDRALARARLMIIMTRTGECAAGTAE